MSKKVAVGISGGVDSSVAALLLLKAGYDVTGVHLQCWDYNLPGCKGRADRADAIKVAASLGIPFVTLNFEQEYKKRVLEYFYSELKLGLTPNPDIVCNKEVKFGLFLDWALKEGFDFVATGHYARIVEDLGGYKLYSGLDKTKDQSYFLYRLGQRELGKALFPIGVFTKVQVREVARKAGFPTSQKPDSTGICFVGDVDIKEFIKREVLVKKGKVLDASGKVIGEHDGVPFYTIGQRKGFTLTGYTGIPMYVISKDAEANTITVGPGKEVEVKAFKAVDISWINLNEQFLCSKSAKLAVRIRNLGEKYPAKLYASTALQNAAEVKVTLDDYAVGVAPGQSVVVYEGDWVLGGGIITSSQQ